MVCLEESSSIVASTKTNNDLLEPEWRFQKLRLEVNSLEAKKQSSVRIIQDYSSQITALGRKLDSYCTSLEQEESRLDYLLFATKKRTRVEALLRQIHINNAKYLRISKSARDSLYFELQESI